jgi:protein SCO1/2
MDPETDTPKRLRQWGAQYGVKKGWTLVTGKKEEMKKLVGHLTGDPLGRLELHSAFVYIGNDKTDHWTTSYGLDDPKALAGRITEISK